MKKNNIKKAALTGVLLFTGLCYTAGQSLEYTAGSCFCDVYMEPGFIAINSSKNSGLDEWYSSVFDLKKVKDFSSKDGRIHGILLRKGEFIVEIIYLDEVLERTDFVPEGISGQWRGLTKFGIYTDANLNELKKCLNDKEIQAGRIFKDRELNIDLLDLEDPEGNFIEIISRS